MRQGANQPEVWSAEIIVDMVMVNSRRVNMRTAATGEPPTLRSGYLQAYGRRAAQAYAHRPDCRIMWLRIEERWKRSNVAIKTQKKGAKKNRGVMGGRVSSKRANASHRPKVVSQEVLLGEKPFPKGIV